MQIPSRPEALAIVEEGDSLVLALVDRLDERQVTAPATIGGGDWSAKDLIAHLTVWERLAVDSAGAWASGSPAPIDAVGDIDAFNEASATRDARLTLREVRGAHDDVHERLAELLRTIGDDAWRSEPAAPEGERPRTLGERLGATIGAPHRPFGHAWAHLPDLKAYVDSVAPAST